MGEEQRSLLEIAREYGWFIFLAVWGGTVSYLTRMKEKDVKFSIVEFLVHLLTSGFAGMMTVHIASNLNFSWQLTAFLAGVAGHMGGKAITLMEQVYKSRVK